MTYAVEFPHRLAVRVPRPGLLVQRINDFRHPASIGADPFRAVLTGYGLRLLKPVRVLSGAWRSETWLVQTEYGGKVLKRYKKSLDQDQIRYEHSILFHLAQHGFPVPYLITGNKGSTIVEHDGRFYSLQEHLSGYFRFTNYFYLPGLDQRFLSLTGHTLGLLHRALEGFEPEGRTLAGFQDRTDGEGIDINRPLVLLEQNIANADPNDPVNARLLKKAGWIAERLRAVSARLLEASPSIGIIHGDYGPNNLLVKPGQPVLVLDFELARREWRLIDLTSALSTVTPIDRRQNKLRSAGALVKGYRSAGAVEPREMRLIPLVWEYQTLRRLVHTWKNYLTDHSSRSKSDIQKRLNRLAWIKQNSDALARLDS